MGGGGLTDDQRLCPVCRKSPVCGVCGLCVLETHPKEKDGTISKFGTSCPFQVPKVLEALKFTKYFDEWYPKLDTNGVVPKHWVKNILRGLREQARTDSHV